jgi:peptidoglycan/LPS O-acetylase OafA/YrhL
LKKYNWIDFGRAIAILLVILVHVGQKFSNSNFLSSIIKMGDMGVQLFFILSSITLFNSFENRFEKDGCNRNKFFFIRRFFRIAPIYYLSAIFYTLIKISETGFSSVSYWMVIVNLLFLNGLILPAINYIPLGGWSIGTEMIFYCTIPLLFKYVKSVKKSFYLLIISIIISNLFNYFDRYFITNFTKYNYDNLRGWKFFYFWFPNQFPVFCFGILLYNLFKSTVNFLINYKNIIIIISILLFFLLSKIPYSNKYPMYFLQREYIYSVVFCLFIIGIKEYSFSNKLSSIFLLIGKYSFCMYLSHFFIIKVFSFFLKIIALQFNFFLCYIIVVSSTFILSKWVYKLEKRGIDYGNNLINKLNMSYSSTNKLNSKQSDIC